MWILLWIIVIATVTTASYKATVSMLFKVSDMTAAVLDTINMGLPIWSIQGKIKRLLR